MEQATNLETQIAADASVAFEAQPLRPGHLMASLDWAAQPLLDMLTRYPDLMPDILQASRRRLHLIALGLAHKSEIRNRATAESLFRGSLADAIDCVLGERPLGLKRALDRLPDKILRAESYRRLVKLLQGEGDARLVYHAEALSNYSLELFSGIPNDLQHVLFRASESFLIYLEHFNNTLKLLVARGAAPDVESLVRLLASARSPRELVSRIEKLVDDLPLPEASPPPRVAEAQRIDHPRKLLGFAKSWKNCAAHYASKINEGHAAIYFWSDTKQPAACLVRRRGRLGWFVEDIKGRENSSIPANQKQAILRAFAEVGVFEGVWGSSLDRLIRLSDDKDAVELRELAEADDDAETLIDPQNV